VEGGIPAHSLPLPEGASFSSRRQAAGSITAVGWRPDGASPEAPRQPAMSAGRGGQRRAAESLGPEETAAAALWGWRSAGTREGAAFPALISPSPAALVGNWCFGGGGVGGEMGAPLRQRGARLSPRCVAGALVRAVRT
jgi:hypothetical protein